MVVVVAVAVVVAVVVVCVVVCVVVVAAAMVVVVHLEESGKAFRGSAGCGHGLHVSQCLRQIISL